MSVMPLLLKPRQTVQVGIDPLLLFRVSSSGVEELIDD